MHPLGSIHHMHSTLGSVCSCPASILTLCNSSRISQQESSGQLFISFLGFSNFTEERLRATFISFWIIRSNNNHELTFIECLSAHTVVSTYHILSHVILTHTFIKKTLLFLFYRSRDWKSRGQYCRTTLPLTSKSILWPLCSGLTQNSFFFFRIYNTNQRIKCSEMHSVKNPI